jgi:ATP-dependent Lon protease
MNNLDDRLRSVFPNESLFKSPEAYSIFSGYNLPSFIKDWVVKKFSGDEGTIVIEDVKSFLEEHIVQKGSKLKGAMIKESREFTLLSRIIVEPDVSTGIFKFSIPDTDIKSNEGIIPRYVVNKNKEELLGGETWGIVKLVYEPPEDNHRGHIEMIDFKPFQPYEINLEYYRENRKEFTLNEWLDVLVRSMEYNPEGFESTQQKLIFISRLLPFVESNLNMIELAPKGTGKSYVFSNLSKYAWLVSGGKITRAQLFYNAANKQSGIITKYDLVTFDEIETMDFGDENELQGALKNYLESGAFTISNHKGSSTAGLMLLGNIQLNEYKKPIYSNYFISLPEFFQSSALLDRFHGFIEGWKLPRIKENMKLKGYTLNVEYFSEILHSLRTNPEFPNIVGNLLSVPKNADTRDTRAIKRICSGYLKLLFPHVTNPAGIVKEDFKEYCLMPAMQMRGIIRKQISLIDKEFSESLPEIDVV